MDCLSNCNHWSRYGNTIRPWPSAVAAHRAACTPSQAKPFFDARGDFSAEMGEDTPSQDSKHHTHGSLHCETLSEMPSTLSLCMVVVGSSPVSAHCGQGLA